MIREYKPEDLAQLLIYGKYFWSTSPYAQAGVEYNADAVVDTVLELVSKHYVRIYELDGVIAGFIGIQISPMPFNPNYTLGTEVFFFVNPDNRGSIGQELLLQAEADMEKWVDILSFGDMPTSTDMSEYYAKNGYTHTETVYGKVL